MKGVCLSYKNCLLMQTENLTVLRNKKNSRKSLYKAMPNKPLFKTIQNFNFPPQTDSADVCETHFISWFLGTYLMKSNTIPTINTFFRYYIKLKQLIYSLINCKIIEVTRITLLDTHMDCFFFKRFLINFHYFQHWSTGTRFMN